MSCGLGDVKRPPINRAGDLKHRPTSGGAPKNAFFIELPTICEQLKVNKPLYQLFNKLWNNLFVSIESMYLN